MFWAHIAQIGRRGVIALAIAVAAVASACNVFRSIDECTRDADCPRGAACAVADRYCRVAAPIRIGVIAPFTSAAGAENENRFRGLQFGRWMVDEHNTQGRVLGRGLEFVRADTFGSAERVLGSAGSLFEANVAAILQAGQSSEVVELQKETFARRLLHISTSSVGTAIGDSQPADLSERFLFQMNSEGPQHMHGIPLMLRDARLPTSFASCFAGISVVTASDVAGTTYRSAVGQVLRDSCIPIVADVVIPRERQPSYADAVGSLIDASAGNAPARCMLLRATTDVAGELLRSLRAAEKAAGRAPYDGLIGALDLASPEFIEDAKSAIEGEPSLAAGFYVVDIDVAPARAELQDLEDLWSEYVESRPEIGADPRLHNRAAFAEGVILLALAFEQAGRADDTSGLRDALVEVMRSDEGDVVVTPKDIARAFGLIRAARRENRKIGIDYRGSYSNFDLLPKGWISQGARVYRFTEKAMEPAWTYTEQELGDAEKSKLGCGK